MSSPSSSSRLISLLGLAVAALPAHADEYSWQLSANASRVETRGLDTDSWAVDGTYYLNAIDDGDGPLALASFLNPTTHVSLEASKTELPLGFLDDPTAFALNGAYVLPAQKWYVGADYTETSADDTGFFSRSESKGYGVEAGRYLGGSTTLELGLGRFEQSSETPAACPPTVCFGTPLDADTTTDSVSLEVFHVRRFRSLTYSLQASVSRGEQQTDIRSSVTSLPLASGGRVPVRTYSVAGELFPTKALGVRLGYTQIESAGYRGDSYDAATTWFFKPRFAIQVGLSRASLELGPDKSDGATVRFIGRL